MGEMTIIEASSFQQLDNVSFVFTPLPACPLFVSQSSSSLSQSSDTAKEAKAMGDSYDKIETLEAMLIAELTIGV